MCQVRIHKFLEKTKRKKGDKEKENEGGDSDFVIKEEEKLRKKVTKLMKKQKLRVVRHIVKGKDDSKPWGQDTKAKVLRYLAMIWNRFLVFLCLCFLKKVLFALVLSGWEPFD